MPPSVLLVKYIHPIKKEGLISIFFLSIQQSAKRGLRGLLICIQRVTCYVEGISSFVTQYGNLFEVSEFNEPTKRMATETTTKLIFK